MVAADAMDITIIENRHCQPSKALDQALISAKEWQEAHEVPDRPASIPKRNPRNRSEEQATTCNTDAAWHEETHQAGFGWVFTKNGEIMAQDSKAASNYRSPLMAEAMAVLLAIQKARDLGIENLILASDSQKLIKALNGEIQLMEIHEIQFDILNLSCNFAYVIFVFVPRESNRQADALAKQALREYVTVPV